MAVTGVASGDDARTRAADGDPRRARVEGSLPNPGVSRDEVGPSGRDESVVHSLTDEPGVVATHAGRQRGSPADGVYQLFHRRARGDDVAGVARRDGNLWEAGHERDVGVDDGDVAPGGDGVLDYLARAFLEPGDSVLSPKPGFAYYPMSARYRDASVDHYSLHKSEDFLQTPETVLERYDGHRIVYLTTPHNPTGSELAVDDIEAIAAGTAEETLVLVDEAYAEFTDTASARQLLDDREDVAVLRTFSKAYGLAGLRLGYALVPSAWASAYERVNTPFSVNLLACRAGLRAIDDREHVERTVETAQWARAYMHDNLDARTWPSGGNFVLAEVGDAEAVTDAAMQDGVIVRDCSSFGLSECIRITCGTEDQTKRAVDVINEVLA